MKKRTLKQRIARKLLNLLKPRYLSLENFLKEELRKELQEEQFNIAMQKIKDLHERRRQGATDWPHIFDFNPDNCQHLKGGRSRILSSYRDYAVRLHTFPDGHSNVKCTICGKEWESDSEEAKNMMRQSTNTPSASERLLTYPQKEENKWTLSSITTAVQTASRRLTSRRKSTRKRS